MTTAPEKRISSVTLWKGIQDPIPDDSTPRYERCLPFPPNPPSYDSDSDANHTYSFATTLRLRASIATTPEDRLREVMIKLVERNPIFQHAVAKELLQSTSPNPPPVRRKRRRSRRSSDTAAPSRKCVNCSQCVKGDRGHVLTPHGETECTYHSGHVQNHVYEFLSRTPEGHTFKVLRTLAMWTCCDEDAWSPGCVTAPAHMFTSDHRPLIEDPEIPSPPQRTS